MNKFLFTLNMLVISIGSLHASCPSGYAEVDVKELYKIVNDSDACPSGFALETDNKGYLPSVASADLTDSKGIYTNMQCVPPN